MRRHNSAEWDNQQINYVLQMLYYILKLINALCIINNSGYNVNIITTIYPEDPIAKFAGMGPKFPLNILCEMWKSF
jgi:hypothetical protein